MTASLLKTIAHELERLVEPLVKAAGDVGARRRLLLALGAGEELQGNAVLGSAMSAVGELHHTITELADKEDYTLGDVGRLLDASADLFAALGTLDDTGAPELTRLGEDLTALLTGHYVRTAHPLLTSVGALLTLVELGDEGLMMPPAAIGDHIVRIPFPYSRLRLDRVGALLKEPKHTLAAEYAPNGLATVADANAVAAKLFPRIGSVLTQLHVPWSGGLAEDELELLGEAAPFVDHALLIHLPPALRSEFDDAGIVLTLSSDDRGGLGLVVSPFGELAFAREAGGWNFESKVAAEVQAFAIGAHGPTFLAGPDTTSVEASFTASRGGEAGGAPAFLFGAATGSRLEIGGVRLRFETALSEQTQAVAVSADVQPGKLVIAAEGDGLLASLMPAAGIQINFDFGLTWSNVTGLALRGGAGLAAVIPIGWSAAGITLRTIQVAIQTHGAGVTAELGAEIHGSIGPVSVIVTGLGLSAILDGSLPSGSFGAVNLRVKPKWPTGIGLVVEAAGVATGGGFLFYDSTKKLYAGVLELSLSEVFTLKAIGLITTQLPDGSPGFTLVIFITAEDFQPIQLGMGFTLNGIGGMLAINRTFDENALREGMKTGILASILFPRDPVANAPAIINALSVAFPARRGAYLFGVLVKIGWFTPTLVAFDLALILELGVRRRLLVLGRVSALLPSADNDLVRLNLESMGVIDFDEGTVALDAILVDSRLVHKFVLTGGMALRARWSEGPGSSFVLAVGGLNPQFAPPAGLPKLDRIAIALSSGNNPRITCEAYFAITANTLQFGARAEVYAAAYGFSIEGDIGFDVLIQYRPLHFVADFHSSVQLKRGSSSLFKVTLDGTLEGPRPLRVSGKASFEICCCNFSVPFDKTLVEGEPPPPPPAIDVLAVLREALADPHSWEARSETSHGVVLRSLPKRDVLIIDPVGRLAVRQQVVPLNTDRDVDRFGGAPVSGDRRFSLTATLNGLQLQAAPVREQFAPSQYFDLTDDEKLIGPSFLEMDAGIAVGDTAIAFPAAEIVPAPVEYESIVIDAPDQPPPADDRIMLEADALQVLTLTGAAARAPVRHVGRARFREAAAAPAVTMHAPEWRIVSVDDRAPIAGLVEAKSWIEQSATLATLNREGVRWQLVPAHELAE